MTTRRHRSTPRRRTATAAAIVALALASSSCAGSESNGGTGRLTVLVASSLVDVVDDLASAWGELPVDVVDAGSQVLAAQLRAGAPADLMLLADEQLASALAEEGAAGAPTVVAHNSLVLVTPPDGKVRDIAELSEPQLRVVLADESVPLGAATRRALGPNAAVVLAGADSLEDAARSVLAKITSGEADAAVVYATDAAAAGDAVRVVPWPDGAAERTVVTIQLVSEQDDAEALRAHITGPTAHDVWTSAGFTLP